jgi:hypothetical protein
MLELSRRHRELENEIIESLRVVDRERLFQSYGLPSLFFYCVRSLGITESVSYAFIAVMRKSTFVPELTATEALAHFLAYRPRPGHHLSFAIDGQVCWMRAPRRVCSSTE